MNRFVIMIVIVIMCGVGALYPMEDGATKREETQPPCITIQCAADGSVTIDRSIVELSPVWKSAIAFHEANRGNPTDPIQALELRKDLVENIKKLLAFIHEKQYQAVTAQLSSYDIAQLCEIAVAADYLGVQPLIDGIIPLLAQRFLGKEALDQFLQNPFFIEEFTLWPDTLQQPLVRHIMNESAFIKKLLSRAWGVPTVAAYGYRSLYSNCDDSLQACPDLGVIKVYAKESGKLTYRISVKGAGTLDDIFWHPHNPYIMASVTRDDTVLMWNLKTQTLLDAFPAEGIYYILGTKVAWHPFSDHIVAVVSGETAIEIRDVIAQKCICQYETGHTKNMYALAWNPLEPNTIASSSNDRTIRVCNIDTQISTVLRGHTAAVTKIAWHPTRKNILASAAKDETVRIWDTVTGKCLRVLQGLQADRNEMICWHPFIPNIIVTASARGSLFVWDITISDYLCELSYALEWQKSDGRTKEWREMLRWEQNTLILGASSCTYMWNLEPLLQQLNVPQVLLLYVLGTDQTVNIENALHLKTICDALPDAIKRPLEVVNTLSNKQASEVPNTRNVKTLVGLTAALVSVSVALNQNKQVILSWLGTRSSS